MNELPVIGSLCYVQRVLGSPRAKQRKMLQRNIWRKVVLASKKTFLGEFSAFLSLYQKRMKAMLIRGKCKFLFK